MADGIGIPDPGAEIPWVTLGPEDMPVSEKGLDLAESLKVHVRMRGFGDKVRIPSDMTARDIADGIRLLWETYCDPDVEAYLVADLPSRSLILRFRSKER